ncbi:MAG: diadenylate cyclase CdaA [Treponema sp.]|nr:diadenylate cyclase CdaA [Treponema sp.]
MNVQIFEWIGPVYTNYISSLLDIVLLAFLLYKAYGLFMKTQAVQMIKGAGLIVCVYGIALILNLNTLTWLLNKMVPGLFIAVAIVFQPELRKLMLRLGQREFFRPGIKPKNKDLEAIVTAAELLAQERRGMLIVFPRHNKLQHIIESGIRINGDISSSLIVAIFRFDGPLHDLATVIQNNKIVASVCQLPLSDRPDIEKHFGSRHRAAIGLSEQSDSVVLVVSEETGAISIAVEGRLFYNLTTAMITQKLRELLGVKNESPDT